MNEENRDEEYTDTNNTPEDQAAETSVSGTEMDAPQPETENEAVDSTQPAQSEPQYVSPSQTYHEPENDTTEPLAASATPVTAEQQPRKFAGIFGSKKQAIIAAVIATLLLVGGVTAYVVMNQSSEGELTTNETSTAPAAKMGVAVAVVDGTATYQVPGESEWTPLTTDSELVEGSQVQTAADSRAILAFDDGSALRLDAETTVALKSLSVDDIQIEQIDGAAYSRVVEGERKYTVVVDGVEYQALGTAFSTLARENEKGVLVFQSSVQASGLEGEVSEGKQYYVANANSALNGKVTGIELAKLVSNAFVAWNVAEDKKDEKFKNKLGVLGEYEKVVADEKAKRKAEAEAKARAEAEAKAAAEKARLEAERKAREAANATAGAMSVKFLDGGIFWEYSKTAENGYKVMYSATNTSPTFGQSGTTSVYVDEPRAQFLGLPKEMKSGKTYYVRVCAYQPSNSSTPCRDYSNVLTVNR